MVIEVRREKHDAHITIAHREHHLPNGERGYDVVKLHEPFEERQLRRVRFRVKLNALESEKKKENSLQAALCGGPPSMEFPAVGRNCNGYFGS